MSVRVATFLAVNEGQRADPAEQETQEAKESRVISEYEHALRCVQRQQAADAAAAFRNVLAEPLVQAAASQQMQRIKFLAFKNLGALLSDSGGDVVEALECYVSACEMESSDVVLWNRLGTLASEAGFWALARHAFERGLQCNPSHPTMWAKLQLLLRHMGDSVAASVHSPSAVAAGWSAPGQPFPAGTVGLLHLPPVSSVLDHPLPSMALAAAREPRSLQLTDATWGALLASAISATAPSQPAPCLVWLSLPAINRHQPPPARAPAAASGTTDAETTASTQPSGLAASAEHPAGTGREVEEVIRLQLTPRKTRPVGAATGSAAVEAAAAEGGLGTEDEAAEHVAVEVHVVALPSTGNGQQQRVEEGEEQRQQDQQALGQQGEQQLASAGGAAAGRAEGAAQHPNGSRCQRRRRSSGWRLQQAEQEAGTHNDHPSLAVLGLASLLGPLPEPLEPAGPLAWPVSAQAQESASQSAWEAPAAACSGAGPAQHDGSPPGRHAEVAAAVQCFVGAVLPAGLHPTQLLLALVERLAASPEAAAALSTSERVLLLRAAQRLHRLGETSGLPAACCLTLSELCLAEAAAAPQAAGQVAAAAGAGPARKVASGRVLSGRGKTRGRQGEGLDRPIPPLQLQQYAGQWLLRYMSAVAAGELDGAAASPAAAALPRPAADGDAEAAAAAGGDSIGGVAANRPAVVSEAAVRYWWARGQLEEAKGAASEASRLYHCCMQALQESGLPAVTLPHWRQPAYAGGQHSAVAITTDGILGKLEILRLHDTVLETDKQAEQGEHKAVVERLARFLLSCDAKEGSMAALDSVRREHALGLLRDSALACGRLWVAAAAQLRLLWQALARLPDVPEAGGNDGAKTAALAQTMNAMLAPGAAGSLASTLESSANFFAAHRRQLRQQGGDQEGRQLEDWEWQLLRRAQRRLLGVVVGSREALVGEGAGSHLSLQAASLRRAMAMAAALTVHTRALDSAAQLGATPTATVLRTLCQALADARALLEGEGSFVMLCVAELRASMAALKAQHGAGISDEEASEESEEPSPADDYWELKCGLHSCLYWLYGIVLLGREDDPWAEDYEPPPMAEQLLSSPEACLEVWPLVEQHLQDQDDKELQKFEGFIHLVAKHFQQPPLAALRHLNASFAHLAACEVPDGMLSSTLGNPLEAPWNSLAAAPEVGAAKAAGAGDTSPGPEIEAAAAAAAAGPQERTEGEAVEEDAEREQAYCSVRSSLYRLLATEQLDLKKAMDGTGILSVEAEGVLERMLAPCKYDLLYNPRRFVGWEQLALTYHEAADWILEDAASSLAPWDWHSEQQAGVRQRYQRFRHLGVQCIVLALRYADSDEDRAHLLSITGHRAYNDLQNVPPLYDQITCLPPSLRQDGAEPASPEILRQRQACEHALQAFEAASTLQPDGWEAALQAARCLRKLGRPATEWLPCMGRACQLATAHAGGILDAVYTLHAARLKLVLSVRSAHSAEGSQPSQQQDNDAQAVLELVARFCFLRDSQHALLPWLQRSTAQRGPTGASAGPGSGQQVQAGEGVDVADDGYPGAAEGAVAAAGGGEARSVPDTESPPPNGPASEADTLAHGSRVESFAGALQLLLHDCLEAVRWCQQKDKQLHRATFRLAEAKLALEGRPAALQELSSLFSRPPKQPFCINAAQLSGETADTAAPGRKGKKGSRARKAAQQGSLSPAAGQGATASELDWGLCPGRVSGTGLEENLSQYYGRVRKYLVRYLQLLSEEGHVDMLRAAVAFLTSSPSWGAVALPSFKDMRHFAICQLVLCMLRSARQLCAPGRLLALPEDSGAEGAAQRLSELSKIAQEVEVETGEAKLELLYQFWVGHSLLPKEDSPGWAQEVQGPAELALRVGGDQVQAGVGSEELARSEALFRAFSELYVLLLAKHGNWEKLLAEKLLLLAKLFKARYKGPQQPSETFLQHVALLCQQVYTLQQQAADTLFGDAAKLRPELLAPAQEQRATVASPPRAVGIGAVRQGQQQQQGIAQAGLPQQLLPASLQPAGVTPTVTDLPSPPRQVVVSPVQQEQQERQSSVAGAHQSMPSFIAPQQLLPHVLSPQQHLALQQALVQAGGVAGSSGPLAAMPRAGMQLPRLLLLLQQPMHSGWQGFPVASGQIPRMPPRLMQPAAPVSSVPPTSSQPELPPGGDAASQPKGPPPSAQPAPSVVAHAEQQAQATAPAGATGQATAAAGAADVPAHAAAEEIGVSAAVAAAAGAGAAAEGALGGEAPWTLPCSEPLAPEELELQDRAVLLLGGLRQLSKTAHLLGQSGRGESTGDARQRISSVVQRSEQLLSMVYRIYAAISDAPRAPTTKGGLHRVCDEAVKVHKRLSQLVPPSAKATAAAGAEAPAAGTGAEGGGGEGDEGGGGARKRARAARGAAASTEPQEEGAAAGAAATDVALGSARKRGRRERLGSASPPPKQPLRLEAAGEGRDGDNTSVKTPAQEQANVSEPVQAQGGASVSTAGAFAAAAPEVAAAHGVPAAGAAAADVTDASAAAPGGRIKGPAAVAGVKRPAAAVEKEAEGTGAANGTAAAAAATAEAAAADAPVVVVAAPEGKAAQPPALAGVKRPISTLEEGAERAGPANCAATAADGSEDSGSAGPAGRAHKEQSKGPPSGVTHVVASAAAGPQPCANGAASIPNAVAGSNADPLALGPPASSASQGDGASSGQQLTGSPDSSSAVAAGSHSHGGGGHRHRLRRSPGVETGTAAQRMFRHSASQ